MSQELEQEPMECPTCKDITACLQDVRGILHWFRCSACGAGFSVACGQEVRS